MSEDTPSTPHDDAYAARDPGGGQGRGGGGNGRRRGGGRWPPDDRDPPGLRQLLEYLEKLSSGLTAYIDTRADEVNDGQHLLLQHLDKRAEEIAVLRYRLEVQENATVSRALAVGPTLRFESEFNKLRARVEALEAIAHDRVENAALRRRVERLEAMLFAKEAD